MNKSLAAYTTPPVAEGYVGYINLSLLEGGETVRVTFRRAGGKAGDAHFLDIPRSDATILLGEALLALETN